MAPKRKRADEAPAATTTRATRRSTRNKAVDEAEVESVASGTTDVTMVTISEPPPPKRTRKAPSKTTKATKSNSKKSTSQIPADADGEAESTSSHADGPHDGTNGNTSKVAKPPRPALKDPEPYSAARAHALFQAYADDEDPSVMGPEGLEQLFGDMQVSLEGAVPLVLAWLCNAEEMAKITLKEWETMTSELQISCLASLSIALHEFEDLLLTNKPALKQSHGTPDKRKKTVPEPYDRRKYYIHSRDRRSAFKALYNFCFVLAKPQQARVIDMETGSAFWSVLLAPQYPLMQELLQFLEDRKNEYKGVNKDQWSMVYDFCLTVSPSLEGYEDDGAWPSMLDAFVEWKKSQSS